MADLIPRRLFNLDRFFSDEGWDFDQYFPVLKVPEPAVDLYETDKDVVVEVSVPGFDLKNIDVAIENQNLYLKGQKQQEEEKKGKDYWRKEIRSESFERIIRLPVAIDEKKTAATFKNGILKITMPKIQPSQEKKIKVKVKEDN